MAKGFKSFIWARGLANFEVHPCSQSFPDMIPLSEIIHQWRKGSYPKEGGFLENDEDSFPQYRPNYTPTIPMLFSWRISPILGVLVFQFV